MLTSTFINLRQSMPVLATRMRLYAGSKWVTPNIRLA